MAENHFHVTGATSGAHVQKAYIAGIQNVINGGHNTFYQRNPTNIIWEKRGTEDSKANKIMERTISYFQSWNKNMVRTAALGQVLDKLNAGTTWLTIKGNPGEGKTTIAYMALEELHRCGRQVYEVRTPEEFKDVISTCPRPVIMLDDVLGSLEFDQLKWSNWAPVVCPLLKEREHKSNEEEDQTSNKDVTVILIGRDYVLKSTSVGLGRLSVFLKSTKHCVCLDHSIERGIKEKRAIWDRISKTSGVELDIRTVNKILEIEVPHGFPHVCRLFTTLYKENNAINACAFFTKPLEFLNESISNLFRDTNKVMLFKEMVKYEGEIRKKELKKLDPTQVANQLLGSYLKYVADYIVFDHPSIYDSVAFQICSLDPEFVIQQCHLSFIHERVRLHMSEVSISDSRLVVHVDRCYADDLAERFADEIMIQHFVHVLSHQVFEERIFVSMVMSKITIPLKSLLHLHDATMSQYSEFERLFDVPTFLAFVPSSKSPELLKYIDNCPDIELTEDDQNYLFYWTCKYAASKALLYLTETRNSFNINRRFCDGHTLSTSSQMTPLMVAAETSDVQFIQLILSLKPDLKARDKDGRTALHYLCKQGLASVVSQVIPSKADVFCKDNKGRSVLFYACRYNQLDVVRLLIESGAIVDAISFNAACKHGSLKIVEMLCENMNPLSKTIVKSSLSAAVQRDIIDNDIMELLVAKGVSVNASRAKLPPLHTACEYDKPQAVNWLLKQGADVNTLGKDDETALHHAAQRSEGCIAILLKEGANVNIKDRYGTTALHRAATSRSKEHVDILLNAGALVNVQNEQGNTPLHESVERGSNDCEEFVDVLLKAGANVNLLTIYNKTPLHFAARKGSKECVDVLLKAGATVNLQTIDGNTPLHYAAERGSKECVDVLLKAGAEVHLQNKDGNTSLYRAVESWHCGCSPQVCVDTLLKAGSTVNIQNMYGNTPLHLLCSSYAGWCESIYEFANDAVEDEPICLEIAGLLIENGADVEINNNQGTPALNGDLKQRLQKLKEESSM